MTAHKPFYPATPAKIVCIGRNYVAHAKELGNEVPDNMVVFFKPGSALSQSLRAFSDEPLHYEGELCFWVENGTFAAVGFGLDLTKRELQGYLKAKGLPWERAKAFDGSVVLSSFVPITDMDAPFSLRLKIDGKVVQQGESENMMYKPRDILDELRTFTSLQDGDVVMTGTPAGVGPIPTGAEFEGSVWRNDECLVSQTWQVL